MFDRCNNLSKSNKGKAMVKVKVAGKQVEVGVEYGLKIPCNFPFFFTVHVNIIKKLK